MGKMLIEGYDAKMCFNYSYIFDGLESLTIMRFYD